MDQGLAALGSVNDDDDQPKNRWSFGQKKAQAEVAGMSQRDRTWDRLREAKPEQPARPARPVVPRLARTFDAKLKRAKRRMAADVIEGLDFHLALEQSPSRKLFPHDLLDKVDAPLRALEERAGVALAAAALQMTRHEKRGCRDPRAGIAEDPRMSEVRLRPKPDQEERQLEVTAPEPTQCVNGSNLIAREPARSVDGEMVEAAVVILVGREVEGMVVIVAERFASVVFSGKNAGSEPLGVGRIGLAVTFDFLELPIARHERAAHGFGQGERRLNRRQDRSVQGVSGDSWHGTSRVNRFW